MNRCNDRSMIYGIFLLDSVGFSLMEVFTEEFFTLKISKRDIFQTLSSFNMENLNYSINGFRIDFAKVDDNHAIGVFVDQLKSIYFSCSCP